MRLQKEIDLGDGRRILLRELRPKDVRLFLENVPEEMQNLQIRSLITEHLPKLIGLLEGECIVMPEGESFEELGFSEISLVKKAFEELHPDFFGMLRSIGEKFLPRPEETSTAAASS